jgi:hypothetical protein
MGILSPFFRELPLEEHGLVWLRPRASVAHPMGDGRAVMLYRSLERTAAGLGADGSRYARLVRPFLARPHELLADVMAPLRIPDHPLIMLRFGVRALWPATWLARLLPAARRSAARGLRGHRCCRLQPAHRGARPLVRGHGARRGLASRRVGRARSRARSRRTREPRRADRDRPAGRARPPSCLRAVLIRTRRREASSIAG